MKVEFYDTLVELLEILGVEYCGSKNFNKKKYFKNFYENVVKRKKDFLMYFHNIHYLDADREDGLVAWWPRIALHRTSFDLTYTPIRVDSIEHGMKINKGEYHLRSIIVLPLSKYEHEKFLLDEPSCETYGFINKYLYNHDIRLIIPKDKYFKTYVGARTALDATFYNIFSMYKAHLCNIIDIYNKYKNFDDFINAISEMEIHYEMNISEPEIIANKDKYWN